MAEAFFFVLAVATLAVGWMSFPLVLLLLAVELVSTVALSALFFPERGATGLFVDVLKMLALCAFCAAFMLAIYAGAGGFRHGPVFDLRGLAMLAALGGVRLGMIALGARRSGDPRLHWTREALLRGGVLMIAMFLSIFAAFIPGLPLATLLAYAWPAVGADIALGSILLLIQGALACVMSTMSDQELADISERPYLR